MTRRVRLVAALVAACLAIPAAGQPYYEQFLAKPLVTRDVAQSEMQDHLDRAIAPMPVVSSSAEWEKRAADLREQLFEMVVFRGKAREWRAAPLRVEWFDTLDGGPGYSIRKLRYEALPGMWIPAALYVPDHLSGKVPVVVNFNGHTGEGISYQPKQARCINQARRGMLALSTEFPGMGQLRRSGWNHYRASQLDLCGTSGLAPLYLTMSRALDLALSLEHADAERLAVTGLSGGGWQTIVISSLDERVRLCNPVAGYSSFHTRARYLEDRGDLEQAPVDLASIADYTHLTAMLAPRAAMLTYNLKDDCCFASGHALQPLLAAARPIYALYGAADRLRYHVNEDPGTHNYDRDNREAFYRFAGRHFYPEGEVFAATDIECASEYLTLRQLSVPLPDDNADFHSLAVELSRNLPRKREMADPRAELREIVRARVLGVSAENRGAIVDLLTPPGCPLAGVQYWRLRVGDFTLPAVELSPESPVGAVLLIADAGRASASPEIERWLKQNRRVLVLDLTFVGEASQASLPFLFAVQLASCGERPLGLQASQLGAVARWLRSRGGGPVAIHAVGPRMCMAARVADALDASINDVHVSGELATLRLVIDEDWPYERAPELFCSGLLESFDIPQLRELGK